MPIKKERSKLSVILFFIKVIWSQSLLLFIGTILAAIFWGFDENIRSFLIKQITDKLDIISSNQVISELLPYVIIFASSLIIRFFILRISCYVKYVHLVPGYKTYIVNYFVNYFMDNSDVTDQKSLNNYTNKVQEMMRFFEDFFNIVFFNIICHSIALAVALISFYWICLSCFYCLIGLILFFMFVALLSYGKQSDLSSKETSSNLQIFSEFNDIILNIFHLKTLNNKEYENDRFNKFFSIYKTAMQNRGKFDFFILSLLSCIFILYHPLCLLFLLWQFQNGFITKGSISYIVMLNIRIPEHVWSLIDDISEVAKLLGKGKSILNDLTLLPSVKFKITNSKVDLGKCNIKFDKIFFNYSNDKMLFKNLSFNIEANTKVGIIGHSGSGKSSILSLLLRLRDPDNGAIYINNTNIGDFSQEQLHDLITVMTQDVSLFNRTVFDNITYGNHNSSMEDIQRVAKLANIDEFIESLPLQYETIITSNGKEFSYGQRQRILIARAFLRNSPILLLDEITASLDNKSEEIILKSLATLMENRTVIVIAHKLYTLSNMDRLIMLSNGKVICEGSHEELASNKDYIELVNCTNK